MKITYNKEPPKIVLVKIRPLYLLGPARTGRGLGLLGATAQLLN